MSPDTNSINLVATGKSVKPHQTKPQASFGEKLSRNIHREITGKIQKSPRITDGLGSSNDAITKRKSVSLPGMVVN